MHMSVIGGEVSICSSSEVAYSTCNRMHTNLADRRSATLPVQDLPEPAEPGPGTARPDPSILH
jgi:hypothetical protein